jgi:hypothetical protein
MIDFNEGNPTDRQRAIPVATSRQSHETTYGQDLMDADRSPSCPWNANEPVTTGQYENPRDETIG